MYTMLICIHKEQGNTQNTKKTEETKMMTNTQIDSKVFEIEMLEAQIKELKALADKRKAELKAELDEKQVDMIDTGINRVWYKAIEKNSLDTKLAKAELDKVGKLQNCMKSSVELRFTITHAAE